MKRGTPDHPKLKRFARAAGLNRRESVATLELLWHFTARYAPHGDLGGFDPVDIAEAVDWEGDPDALIDALGKIGWLDPDYPQAGSLYVHDWHVHADDATRKSLERRGELFAGQVETRGSIKSRQDRDKIATVASRQSSASPSPSPHPLPPEEEERASPGDSLGAPGDLPLAGKAEKKPPSAAAIDLCAEFTVGLRRRMVMAPIPSRADHRRRWEAQFDKLLETASPEQIRSVFMVLADPGHFWSGKVDTPKVLIARFASLFADAQKLGLGAQASQGSPGATFVGSAEQRRRADRERVVRELMGGKPSG